MGGHQASPSIHQALTTLSPLHDRRISMRHSKQFQARIVGAALVALTLTAVQPARAQAKQAGAAAKLNDPTIVAIFDAANTWDVETGQLAVKKGTTKEVRD